MDDKEFEEMMREIGGQIMFQLNYTKSPESFESTNNSELFHATGGAWTRTLSPERDFKSLVSANFTTVAYRTRLTKPCCLARMQRAGKSRNEVKNGFSPIMAILNSQQPKTSCYENPFDATSALAASTTILSYNRNPDLSSYTLPPCSSAYMRERHSATAGVMLT